MIERAAIGWAIAVAVMALLWAWQRRSRNAAVAEAGWALLVAALGILYAVRSLDGMEGRRIAVASMTGSWGARVAIYILYLRVIGKPEEPWYAARRETRGDTWFFWYFQALAVAAVLASIPALLSTANASPDFSTLELVAAGLWFIGFAGAATADRQRLHFTMDPANAGLPCRVGLWRYSSHPQYVFEAITWSAYVMLAVEAVRVL